MSEFFNLFEDIDTAVHRRFGPLMLPLKIIGRAALELAGLPDRGTKDVDALEDALRVGTLTDSEVVTIEDFLKAEFGKSSPGDRRHGLYLDLVGSIAWLPKDPRFIDERRYTSIVVSRLHPTDVCVSKTFSNFKGAHGRGRDLADITEALDAGLIDAHEYVQRMDESFLRYEQDSEAPLVFPLTMRFLTETIIPDYCEEGTALTYEIPSWMENM